MKVLQMNNHFPLAYDGLGMTQLRQKNYAQAMEYFRLANNRDYYSKAFAHYRKQVIERTSSDLSGSCPVWGRDRFVEPVG